MNGGCGDGAREGGTLIGRGGGVSGLGGGEELSKCRVVEAAGCVTEGVDF